MYCRHCGKQIPDDSNVCPECGTRLNETAAPRQAQMQPQPIVVNVNNVNSNVNTNNNGAGAGYPYKKRWAAFFLCLFLGEFGVHRFYVGKAGSGILYLFTLGIGGVGWLIDLLLILFGAFRDKAGYPLR